MKTKDLKELKIKEKKELETLVSKKKFELMKNAVKLTSSKEKNIKLAKNLRKEIAQILTILSDRKESNV